MGPVEKCLRDARELIRKPEAWTKGAFARTRTGHPVSLESEVTESFCLIGSLIRTSRDLVIRDMATEQIQKAIGSAALSGWNDEPGRKHAHVVAAVSLAIARAKRKGL